MKKLMTWRTTAIVVLVVMIALTVSTVAGWLPPVFAMLGLVLLLATLFWPFRRHLASILLAFMAVLLISIVVTQRAPKVRATEMNARNSDDLSAKWRASGTFRQDLPIVLHIVLDEMMSPGAMTADLPGGPQTRQALLDFGEKHSMRTYDSVYSRYFESSDVFSSLMGREYLGRTDVKSYVHLPYDEAKKIYTIKDNAYFADMAARGYRTVVFQSTYLDFCADKHVAMCETFDSFDLGKDGNAGLDARTERVRLWQTVFRAYEPSFTSAAGLALLDRIYGLRGRAVGVLGVAARYDVRRFPGWFDYVTSFISQVPRGTHVFAHFLVPHSPYVLTENCVVSGEVDTGYYLWQFEPVERPNKRLYYYEPYLGQVRCVAKKLDDLMNALKESENFRDATIIIHGDHGSRISVGDMIEYLTPRDYLDNYAAYFAIRSPAGSPGVDCELTSLPQLFRRSVAPPAAAKGPSAPLPVIITSQDAAYTKVEAPMPRFGCAGGG